MSGLSLDQRFAGSMGQLLGPDFPSDIALAVSGGGDSMAMLALAHNWARSWGVSLWIVTIDHHLRPESTSEAAFVASEAQLLGHRHCILNWHWDGQGNVQSRAREARLSLLHRWRGQIAHVLFAHTSDDVAETFLMRLARQAGVEGLAEMQQSRVLDLPPPMALSPEEYEGDVPQRAASGRAVPANPVPVTIIRPCLDMSRAELRHYARTLQMRWIEDPSNEDGRFDRVRMRKLLPVLEEAGLSRQALVRGARHMARAGDALRLRAAERFGQIGLEGSVDGAPTGEILFDRSGFEETERDTQLRLLSYACAYISSQAYRPREAPLEALLERLLGGGGGTLHGCELRMERTEVRLFREYKAVAGMTRPLCKEGKSSLWDARWHVTAAHLSERDRSRAELRALGEEGWAQVQTRPDGAPPFAAARSLPALWLGGTLVHCDVMRVGIGQTCLWPMGKEGVTFRQFLLSH